jgi:monoamine oxidase
MGDEKTPGTLERGIAVTDGAQQWRLVGGSQQVSVRCAEQLDGRVILNAPVRAINQESDVVTVVSDAGSWSASQVVVAIPPALAARITWSPLLPPQQDALFSRLTFGSLMKCEAVYDTPFWREDGLSGQAVFRSGTPICSMFDNTPQSGGPGVLMGFLGGPAWTTWAARSPNERRATVLRAFAQVVGRQALRPSEYFEQDWTSEPFTRGGPTAITPPGLLSSLGSWRDRAFGRVHWAGAEHSDYWNGYMDGAVRSGKDAAHAVIEEAA